MILAREISPRVDKPRLFFLLHQSFKSLEVKKIIATPTIVRKTAVRRIERERFVIWVRFCIRAREELKITSRQANAIKKPTAAVIANLNCFLNSFLKVILLFTLALHFYRR